MNIRNNPSLRNKLAAEYALGTMRGPARRRFETWLRDDAALRNLVADWEARLVPMAEFSPSVQPSKKVWRDIEQRLNVGRSLKKSWLKSWQNRLNDNIDFWRTLGLTSTGMACVLVAVLTMKLFAPSEPAISYVAALSDEKAETAMLVTADTTHRTLAIKVLGGRVIAGDKTLQLWAIPKDGTPRSLGILADNKRANLVLPENATSPAITLLAVSLEPKGGSPNPNGPTGPILYKGTWLRI